MHLGEARKRKQLMHNKLLQARLENLVELGWGEWLLRNANTLTDATRLVDYGAHRKRRFRLSKAKGLYHRRRMKCVVGCIRENRKRSDGVIMKSVGSKVFRIGGDNPTDQIKIEDKSAHAPYAEQAILTVGELYRVRGLHRSELTGGWVEIMDCDVDGTQVRSPTLPDTEFTEFDNLGVYEEM